MNTRNQRMLLYLFMTASTASSNMSRAAQAPDVVADVGTARSLIVLQGQTLRLSLTLTSEESTFLKKSKGMGEARIQWVKDGFIKKEDVKIDQQRTNSLDITNVSFSDVGSYSVFVHFGGHSRVEYGPVHL